LLRSLPILLGQTAPAAPPGEAKAAPEAPSADAKAAPAAPVVEANAAPAAEAKPAPSLHAGPAGPVKPVNGPAADGPDPWLTFGVPLMLTMIAFYLIMLNPEKQKEASRKKMLASLKKNTKVVTIGGIKGVVVNVREGAAGEDAEVVVRVDEDRDVKMTFTQSAIARVVAPKDEAAKS
ncbi:MAG: preprotein translocase subunit YajC, partial [Planctomycetia bacterium]